MKSSSPPPGALTRRTTLTALGFLAPNFLGFFLFVAFPVLFSVVIVATNWSLMPAVETRFVGVSNLWTLLGFRPIAEASPSGGAGWLAGFFGAWAGLLAAVVLTFLALGRHWRGLKLGGAILLAAGGILIVAAAAGPLGAGAALFGLTLLFAAFFLFADEESSWTPGAGALGPALLGVSLAAVYGIRGAFFARWEPLDARFWQYFYNTLYLMVAIPISIAGSLGLALILSQPVLKAPPGRKAALAAVCVALALLGGLHFWWRGHFDTAALWAVFWGIAALGLGAGVVAFRTLFFLPSFTAGIAIMLLWKQMFNPTFGPINETIRVAAGALGLSVTPPNWLNSITWAKPALMLMNFWIAVGGPNMLLYLAGISNIPQDLYAAAAIEGANRRQAFWNVTWPQLAPTTFFIVIMSVIGGLQGGFEQARVMTEGGPAGSTKTLAYYVYEKAFMELQFGFASAIAWVLFAIIFVMTAINWRFGNRYVNY